MLPWRTFSTVRLQLNNYSCIRLGGDSYSPLHNINTINLINPKHTPHDYDIYVCLVLGLHINPKNNLIVMGVQLN